MGVEIAVSSIPPEMVNGVRLPDVPGLVAYHEFRSTDPAVALKNLVRGGAPAVPTGSPIYSTTGVTLDADDFLSTVDDSAGFTRYLIANAVSPVSPPSGNSHGWMGNWVNGQGGTMVTSGPQTTWRLTNTGLSAGPNLAAGDISIPFLMSIRVGTNAMRLGRHTPTADVNTVTVTAYTPAARPVRIGGLVDYLPIKARIFAAVNRAVSDAEDALILAALRTRALSKFGLTV